MKIIKLDAIDSTNDFLKGLSQNQTLENMTVVTAKKQTKGRGQMGTNWLTEEGKNIITSILIKDTLSNTTHIFDLNIAVAIAITEVLIDYKISEVSIKWPNDIMSGNKKIGGILIENSIKENNTIESIVGIGLNVNQTNFENLPKASSLKVITQNEYDVEALLMNILQKLEEYKRYIVGNKSDILWEKYHDYLFKIGKPLVFENEKGLKFMGIIQKVNRNGRLEVLLEDETTQTFGIKEISMIY